MRSTWLLGFLGVVAACGGRQVTSESTSGNNPPGLGGTTNTGGAGALTNTGSGGAFGTGGTVQTDLPPNRCAFGATTAPAATPPLPGFVVLVRITGFIVGPRDAVPSDTPAQATPEWAADTASKLLDSFGGASSAAPGGFVRWLAKWSYDGKAPLSASRWAKIMADPSATLSSLIAAPNPDNAPHGVGYITDKEILTGRPSIDRRGMMISDQLLCRLVPPAPPNVMTFPPTLMPGVTERQAHEQNISNASCKACHGMLDPFGHAFGHFDRSGEYRDVDNGLAIDSSDVFTMPDGSSVKFTSIEDLAPQLAQSCDVARCVAKSLLREALNPDDVPQNDAFTDDEVLPIADAFANSGFSMRALIRAIVSSPPFLR